MVFFLEIIRKFLFLNFFKNEQQIFADSLSLYKTRVKFQKGI